MAPIAITSVALLVAAMWGATSLWFRNTPTAAPALPESRTSMPLPNGLRLDPSAPLALSPDGTLIAFVAGNDDGARALYLRPLASNTATELKGTAGASHPFFSPDGRAIGFFASESLHRIGVDGSAPQRICPLPGFDHGGAWGANDIIVVAIRGRGLFKVKAGGGTLEPIASDLRGAWPSFLPDGATVMYTGVLNQNLRTVRVSVVALDGAGRRDIARLSDESGNGAPVLGAAAEIQQAFMLPQGYLVYGQDPGYVRALPVDPETLAARGPSRTLADLVERGAGSGGIAFAAASTGVVVFAPTGDDHQLVWVTRQGAISPVGSQTRRLS